MEEEDGLTNLTPARSRGDNNNRGQNHQIGRGGKGSLTKLHFGMEEKETGMSGSERATGECWGPIGQTVLKACFEVLVNF
jgi:hypothetical protein